MEMDNFLSNTQIGKILSNLFILIKENYKFVLYSTAGFLFISLISLIVKTLSLDFSLKGFSMDCKWFVVVYPL